MRKKDFIVSLVSLLIVYGVLNLILFLFKTLDWFASILIIKTTKNKKYDTLKNILISFALIALFAIFITLFWRF